MARAIPLGAPLDIPARVHEHRLAPHIAAAEQPLVERTAGALRCPGHDAVEVRDGLERIVSNVLAAVVPMEWRVDVSARVGDQLDLPDLECRAGSVPGLGRIAR